jgi:hypothetical protein
MKKNFYYLLLIVVCLLSLTSCSRKFNFVTKGLPSTDSSYLITKEGKQIDATTIDVWPEKIMVDGVRYPKDKVANIRSKKMYFAVNNDVIYSCEIYGKICVLYKVEMSSTYSAGGAGFGGYSGGGYGGGMGGGYHTTAVKVPYLEKLGSTEIDRMNPSTVVDYVADDDAALAVAKGGKTWHIISYVPAAGFAGGVIYTFVLLAKLNKSPDSATPNFGPPLAIAGVSALAGYITNGISKHKMYKAIKIYNGN